MWARYETATLITPHELCATTHPGPSTYSLLAPFHQTSKACLCSMANPPASCPTPAPTQAPSTSPTTSPTKEPTSSPTQHEFTDTDFKTAFQQCIDINGNCLYGTPVSPSFIMFSPLVYQRICITKISFEIKIGDWDVSRVENFSGLFLDSNEDPVAGADSFNEALNWNTGA